ncbi:NADH-ubiquinone oxidoreductase B22 subunit [Loa loa]|uniref:NADH dehydrogenase [ubiquinone] 1 beta subcomplex subunit 9 n=1 Tax=Loa loa TaxID=7209 RepID=A0A1S0TYB2_LOALO|nr:NADH-ubiquinone oxidoreductase B22 subunit [Loa loa]EFO22163.1 NADH-ubiquinone oxidoreductase B22 subunit [Loa loa]
MESPSWMFSKALSHRQKVCRLFKRAMREVDGYYGMDILEARFQKVIMRARFDAYREERDPDKARLLYLDGCRQVWDGNIGLLSAVIGSDVGGAAYNRDTHNMPDAMLDSTTWTNVEREQFPYYFNRREQRKKELLAHWSKIEKEWDDELAKIQTELPKEKEAEQK